MNITPFLDLIAKGEVSTTGPEGYDTMYRPAEQKLGKHKLSLMTLDQVRTLQEKMVASRSSACGRYQFIRKTFDATRAAMHLPGTATWSPDLQDKMAIFLLQGRGLARFMSGSMTREDFANSIAKEWASLPVVTPIQGAKRKLKVGQSFYAGDGLNKALIFPEDVLMVLDSLRLSVPHIVPDAEPLPSEPIPAPSEGLTSKQIIIGVALVVVVAVALWLIFG